MTENIDLDLRSTPWNHMKPLMDDCIKKYFHCLEQFLIKLGANQNNAAEFQLIYRPQQPFDTEIHHNGQKVGEVTAKWESAQGYGYRFLVECRLPTTTSDGVPCQYITLTRRVPKTHDTDYFSNGSFNP